ncbi:hypothetical protein ACB098_08G070800 [Castanea mollissima]
MRKAKSVKGLSCPGKNTQAGFIIPMSPRAFMVTAPSSVLRKFGTKMTRVRTQPKIINCIGSAVVFSSPPFPKFQNAVLVCFYLFFPSNCSSEIIGAGTQIIS